jgi:outer membrane immunogenic protein
MKKFLLTTTALAALALPAMAADMAPAPIAYKAPIPVPVCIWCGFYVGLNAGGTWSDDNSVSVTSAATQDFDFPFAPFAATATSGNVSAGNRAGFIGGGQIGYNWQLAPVWFVGFETDIQGATGNGSGTVANTVGPFPFGGSPEVLNSSISASSKLDYLGTVRGRLGYLFTPTFLLYGTGGLAYGGVKASTSIASNNNDCVFFPGSCLSPSASTAGAYSSTRAGWTAGAGFEWMFLPKWSAKVEYLHYDLGSVNFANGALVTGHGTSKPDGPAIVTSSSSTNFTGEIVRAGVNYHW